MREICTIKELQAIEIDILKYVDEVCREHNLKYFLAYGTLLGAVRHKGFIPWDDDMDIMMPREDYKKLCRILHEKGGRYQIRCMEYNKDYMYGFAKIIDNDTVLVEQDMSIYYELGVYIDVFPYDGLPGELQDNVSFLKRCALLEKCRYFSIVPFRSMAHKVWWKNIIRLPFWIFIKLYNYRNIVKRLDRMVQRYPVENSKWVGCWLSQTAFERNSLPSEAVTEVIDGEFEGCVFKIPSGYDKILTKHYGDYMQLPPEEGRVAHHNYKAWWK